MHLSRKGLFTEKGKVSKIHASYCTAYLDMIIKVLWSWPRKGKTTANLQRTHSGIEIFCWQSATSSLGLKVWGSSCNAKFLQRAQWQHVIQRNWQFKSLKKISKEEWQNSLHLLMKRWQFILHGGTLFHSSTVCIPPVCISVNVISNITTFCGHSCCTSKPLPYHAPYNV